MQTLPDLRRLHHGDVPRAQRPDAPPAAGGKLAGRPFADNQLFATVATSMKNSGFRVTAGLLGIPDDYERLKILPPSPHRLPATPGQPDFAWADETDGVVAIKRGDDLLYASLFWRAGYGVNSLARVHALHPRWQGIAVVAADVKLTPSGKTYTRPDWTNFGFGDGGVHLKYPADLHQALAGEALPIAKAPDDVKTPS